MAAQQTVADASSGGAAAESGKSPNAKWYVIHTYSGYENKVKTNLEHRIASMDMAHKIYRVVVPTEEEVEIKNGQRRTVQRKLYPGYVLVEMDLSEDSWYVVRNTPGVTSFVGSGIGPGGNDPIPLPESEAQAILKQMREEKPQVRITYHKSDRVKIIDGPFAEFLGTIDAVDEEKTKLRVLVSMFGRETPVELDFLQVEKA